MARRKDAAQREAVAADEPQAQASAQQKQARAPEHAGASWGRLLPPPLLVVPAGPGQGVTPHTQKKCARLSTLHASNPSDTHYPIQLDSSCLSQYACVQAVTRRRRQQQQEKRPAAVGDAAAAAPPSDDPIDSMAWWKYYPWCVGGAPLCLWRALLCSLAKPCAPAPAVRTCVDGSFRHIWSAPLEMAPPLARHRAHGACPRTQMCAPPFDPLPLPLLVPCRRQYGGLVASALACCSTVLLYDQEVGRAAFCALLPPRLQRYHAPARAPPRPAPAHGGGICRLRSIACVWQCGDPSAVGWAQSWLPAPALPSAKPLT